MLQRLQNRIRAILATDALFAPPVQIFIEDKAGLDFLYAAATAKLNAPAILITSLGGDATASAQGAFLATERFRISILRTPLYDQFPHSTAALVEAAITALHEAPLVTINPDAGETLPRGYLRFHVLAHADASQTPALREHTLTLEAAFTSRKSRYL